MLYNTPFCLNPELKVTRDDTGAYFFESSEDNEDHLSDGSHEQSSEWNWFNRDTSSFSTSLSRDCVLETLTDSGSNGIGSKISRSSDMYGFNASGIFESSCNSAAIFPDRQKSMRKVISSSPVGDECFSLKQKEQKSETLKRSRQHT